MEEKTTTERSENSSETENTVSQENADFSKFVTKDDLAETTDKIVRQNENSLKEFKAELKTDLSQSEENIKNSISEATSVVSEAISKASANENSEILAGISELGKKAESFAKNAETEIAREIGRFVSNLNSEFADIKSNLLTESQRLSQKNAELNMEIGSLKGTIEALKSNNAALQRQLDDAQKNSSVFQQQYISEKGRAEKFESEFRREFDEKSAECANLYAQLEVTKQELIVKDEELDQLFTENKAISGELDSKVGELERLSSEKAAISGEMENLKSKYADLKIDETLLSAFNEYSSLQDKTKDNLDSIFPHRTFIGFVVAALRLTNISSLWELTKRNIFNNKLEDVDKLNKIFTILLSVYNEGSKEKQFDLIIPEIGSKYDSSTCAIKEMKSSGNVSLIHLAGYKNLKDGNIHKAVISVTD